ncbi:MAG TPA: N-acetylmuramoyl-L-alanine amidase-like domain-containing protein [Rhodothermales bacterium]
MQSTRLPIFLVLATALFPTACQGEPRVQDEPMVVHEEAVDANGSVPEPDSLTQRLFDDVMEQARAENLHQRPIGEMMQEIGLQFRAKPYLTGVLDAGGEETLVCRLDGFDCVTFLESALALARTIRSGEYSWDAYALTMRDQRYRGGEMEGYCSRLHYFSDWIADNERRGNVRDITRELGGVPLEKDLNFMSTHRESYPRFATNDSLYQCIIEMEADLRDRELYYIPEDRIASVYDRLQAGDIIATATNIDGLDVTHTGLVYEHGDGRIGLLHASTSGGVKVSPDLQSYVQDNRSQIGIVVARPLAR